MGKYDGQIKNAKKIGDEWVKTAEGYAGSFQTIKKEHLALEKGALNDIQKAVAKNEPNLVDHLDELETIKERLQMFYNEGEKLYKEFDKWALAEPRKSMEIIAKKLQLGDSNSEAYKAVSAGIKTQLTDVAGAIAATQRAWRSDLEIALKNHMDKLDTLEKIINKDVGKTKGFLDQLDKAIDRFADECGKVYAALKVDLVVRDVEDIMKGEMAKKEKIQIEQKYHQTEQKIALIPKLTDQIDKNYGRVVKTVPPEVLNAFTSAAAKKKLNDVYNDAKKKMAYVTKVCESALKGYKEKELV